MVAPEAAVSLDIKNAIGAIAIGMPDMRSAEAVDMTISPDPIL